MTEGDFLQHFGVKGMRWGVNKVEGSTSSSSNAKKQSTSSSNSKEERIGEYLKRAAPKLSAHEKAKALSENQKKFSDKFGGDAPNPKENAPEKGWRPTKKQITYGIIGAAAVGAIVYGTYKYGKYIHPPAGMRVDTTQFAAMINHSKTTSWDGVGYIKPSSFNQKEFTLPAGHVFHRISTTVESEIRGSGNYVTHSIEDFNRYVAGFRGEKGQYAILNHITFKATSDIKVPDLLTRLETLGETLNKISKTGQIYSPEVVKQQYMGLSGGSWSGDLAKKFFEGLSVKGYGAIVDDMDAGVIGESPLFVFAKGALTPKISIPLTTADILAAESNIFEFANRK